MSGTGAGTVTSTPSGISCPGTSCTLVTPGGTSVTLTAAPSVGSTFFGWSGGSCSGNGACAFSVTADVSITAAFVLNQYPLTVTRAGTGTGTVTSSPAGINCGSDCGESISHGTTVILTAASAVGSTFTGWSGGSCVGTGTCMVQMTAATTVTATFTLNQYTLSASRAGTGTGTITSSPAGINCGADCTEVYNHGSSVILSASPAVGSTFAGWGGACSGTGTCVVTFTAASSVTATFTLNQYALTVAREGTGIGTVTGTGIACGADCTELFSHGSVVTLTASVIGGAGSTFSGWSGGGCTGTGNCIVTMTGITAVFATFTLSGPGQALSFDGANDLATLATSSLLDTGVATVEAWVFLNSATTGAAVSLWGGGGLADKYMLQFTGGTPPQSTLRIVRGGVAGQLTTSAAVPLNTWVHLALVFDGVNLSQFQNGTLVSSTAAPGVLGSLTGPMKLGIEELATTGTFMNGRIDEVRIWSVARSASQILASYNKLIAPTTTGLTAYYRFDEGSGQVVLDATINVLHGVLGTTNGVAGDDPARISSTAPVTP